MSGSSLVNLGPQWMNPSIFPSDNRQSIYQRVNLNNQERNNQYQTPQNNSNLWRDNLPAKRRAAHGRVTGPITIWSTPIKGGKG